MQRSLPNEENTQRIGTAVGGNRATRSGYQDFLEGQGVFYRLCHTFYNFGIASCMGHKHTVKADIVTVCQSVGNIANCGSLILRKRKGSVINHRFFHKSTP